MFARANAQSWASLPRMLASTRAHQFRIREVPWTSFARLKEPPSRRNISTTFEFTKDGLGVVIGDIGINGDHHSMGSIRGEPLAENTKYLELPNLWMRDNCQCSQCVNPDTMQRNFDTYKLDPNLKPTAFNSNDRGLQVVWSDGHESVYVWPWVEQVVTAKIDPISEAWNRRELFESDVGNKGNQLSVPYEEVIQKGNGGRGMGKLMEKIKSHGFAFVSNTPVDPAATEDLLEHIGPIRNTHYGGFYDFIPDLASADTAYTNLALAPHTDTTYFTEPAGLQAFHMLSHEPPPGQDVDKDNLGGESVLVDGFSIAVEMKRHHHKHYRTLCGTSVPWHASGNLEHSITPNRRYPVIEAGRNIRLLPKRIRWNNDDRGAVPLHEAEGWYAAAKVWNSYVQDPKYQYWFQLEPGSVLIFDNWRLLHGRRAFEGRRRVCGAYINRDDFFSKWKLTTNRKDVEVITHNLIQFGL